jgi:hypothetical protein
VSKRKEPVSPGGFEICGQANWRNPAQRCSFRKGHLDIGPDVHSWGMDFHMLEAQMVNETDPTPEEQLAQWWRDTAESEIKQTVAKAVEYGATDLIDIGQTLARVAGRTIGDAEAAEWGIFFYLEGKLSRWRSAIERGDLPSFDTLLDIGVYARMAQRVRQEGGWPFEVSK